MTGELTSVQSRQDRRHVAFLGSVGVEFALSGNRDMNNMISQHSALGRLLATQLGLPEAVQVAVGAAYEQWDGKTPVRLSGGA